MFCFSLTLCVYIQGVHLNCFRQSLTRERLLRPSRVLLLLYCKQQETHVNKCQILLKWVTFQLEISAGRALVPRQVQSSRTAPSGCLPGTCTEPYLKNPSARSLPQQPLLLHCKGAQRITGASTFKSFKSLELVCRGQHFCILGQFFPNKQPGQRSRNTEFHAQFLGEMLFLCSF